MSGKVQKRLEGDPTRADLLKEAANLRVEVSRLKEALSRAKDNEEFSDALDYLEDEKKEAQALMASTTLELQNTNAALHTEIEGYKKIERDRQAQKPGFAILHKSKEAITKELETLKTEAQKSLESTGINVKSLESTCKAVEATITKLELLKTAESAKAISLKTEVEYMKKVISDMKAQIELDKADLTPFDVKNKRYQKAWKITKLYLLTKAAFYKCARVLLSICTLGLYSKLKPLVNDKEMRESVKTQETILGMVDKNAITHKQEEHEACDESFGLLTANIEDLNKLSAQLAEAMRMTKKSSEVSQELQKANASWRITRLVTRKTPEKLQTSLEDVNKQCLELVTRVRASVQALGTGHGR